MSRFLGVVGAARAARGFRVGAPVVVAPPAARTALSLRGDPAFDPASLPVAQRTRLSTMKALIDDNEAGSRNPWWQASYDCIWWYSHDFASNILAQSIAFRITGDMYFLDTMYELAERTREKLHDSWRGELGTDVDPADARAVDGFLNWVHRYSGTTNAANRGTDLREDYDFQAHAVSVFMAWIMHNNRDLTSPRGYDYGEHADYMRLYHEQHFEAKWRARKSTATGFPIWSGGPGQNDRWMAWSRWHYYMGLLTGDVAYTNEAISLSDHLLVTEFCQASTGIGDAYVYKRNNTVETSVYGQTLMASSYAAFIYGYALDYYLQGFDEWADSTHLTRLVRALSQFMMDDTVPNLVTRGLSPDVGGGVARCSYPSSATLRLNAFNYQNSTLGWLAPWDTTGTVRTLNESMRAHALTQNWDYMRVLAAQMLDTHLNPLA